MRTGISTSPKNRRRCGAANGFRTSDLRRIDEDGYLWFEGRADDVILSAGHRIGPTEVENTLLNHEAVAEAAVVGLPTTSAAKSWPRFVVLRDGFSDFRELRRDIQQYVRGELSKTKYPREIIVRRISRRPTRARSNGPSYASSDDEPGRSLKVCFEPIRELSLRNTIAP